jgi:hypothetical protein
MTRKRSDIPVALRSPDREPELPAREEIDPDTTVSEPDLPAREAELASKRADLDAARQLLVEAQVAVRGLEREVEYLVGVVEGLRPKLSDAEEYQAYLRRQSEIRQTRAERRPAARKMPSVERSPLDMALAARVKMRRRGIGR